MSIVGTLQHPAGHNPPNEDGGGLGNLPDPGALKGMQITAQHPGTNSEQQFSLVTLLASQLQIKISYFSGPCIVSHSSKDSQKDMAGRVQ